MPRQRRPVHAELLTEYAELRFFARKFAQGFYNCLIFVGPPGRLKTSIIEAETRGRSHMISGHAMPFEVFCEAQEHKDVPLLVIDDADGLYGTPDGLRLLKALTNPRSPKKVSWVSNAPAGRGLAKTFETASKVCIIDNAWGTQSEHVAALEDRARLFLFDPPPAEVHEEMGRQDWFADDDIYRFVGDNLCFLADLSARSYVKAAEAKEAGEDWRAYLLKSCIDRADLTIILLEYEAGWRDRPVEDKAQEFQRRVGMCRATFFNRKRNLLGRMAGHPLAGRWSVGG